jgi:hypothetical protein
LQFARRILRLWVPLAWQLVGRQPRPLGSFLDSTHRKKVSFSQKRLLWFHRRKR